MAFKRIVAKSEDDLETIIDNIKSWFQESEDYNIEFTKENRKFQDPNTLKIVEKSIDVIKAVDKNNGNVASIKFIPMKEKEQMKLEIGGEGESAVAGKISNQMKGKGVLKSYSKDAKKPLKENKIKKSELKQIIKEEIKNILKEGDSSQISITTDNLLNNPKTLIVNKKITIKEKTLEPGSIISVKYQFDDDGESFFMIKGYDADEFKISYIPKKEMDIFLKNCYLYNK